MPYSLERHQTVINESELIFIDENINIAKRSTDQKVTTFYHNIWRIFHSAYTGHLKLRIYQSGCINMIENKTRYTLVNHTLVK